MNALKLSLCFLLLTGPALLADAPVVSSSPKAADPLAEALPVLQASYVDFASLHYQSGDHLSDLVARSDGKIRLDPPEISSPVPIITAALPGGIVYWRLACFTPKKNWDDLAADLKTMIEFQHAVGAILDLRSNTAPDDYAGAARVAAFFVPGDHTLDKYLPQKSDGILHLPAPIPDREFQGPLVVLTNNQTSGAAEALAACLQADGALVVGRTTAGKTPYFEEQTLSSGQILRFVPAQATLADGTPLLGHVVTPDLTPTVDDWSEKAALVLIRDDHISDVIQESAERHCMSEAALVQGDDPEWDDYVASLEKKPDAHFLLSLPPIHDVVLTSALDSLKAIRVSLADPPAPTPADIPSGASTSLR